MHSFIITSINFPNNFLINWYNYFSTEYLYIQENSLNIAVTDLIVTYT